MSNGDSQQQNETLQALKDVFLNSIEGSCGWHVGELFFEQMLSTHNMSTSQHYYPFNFSHQWIRDGRHIFADHHFHLYDWSDGIKLLEKCIFGLTAGWDLIMYVMKMNIWYQNIYWLDSSIHVLC